MSDLRGLDFLSEKNAAVYSQVSLTQFRKKAGEYGLSPFRFMGKLMYRKAEIQAAMEKQWQQYTSAGNHTTSSGLKMENVTELRSAK